VDARSEIREFLASRRARISPEQAGLVAYGSRRVPGLRREEVAVLAGVSVPYYTRIERGDMNGVSDSVLQALSRALQLDEAEHAHLFDLARAVQPTTVPRRRRPATQPIRPSVQHILDAITGAAAFVRNDRLDVLAANDTVAVHRASAGRDPTTDASLTSSESSPPEATSSEPAGPSTTSASTSPASNTSTTQSSATSASEPGSRHQETLRLLGSWAATLEQPAAAQTTDHP
jgi:transcriptional regulator with XRE-family HTH domain